MFYVDLRTNSDYFPIQPQLTGFYNRDLTLCSPVVIIFTDSLTFKILRSAHTLYLCVLCGSENKQRLFPYTALTEWFYSRDLKFQSPVVTICTASLTFKILRSAHTVYLCVLCGSENKQRLFPYTTLTDWFL